MKKVMEDITAMQCHLNKLLAQEEELVVNTAGIYTLSVMLDKEIVKYYRDMARHVS